MSESTPPSKRRRTALDPETKPEPAPETKTSPQLDTQTKYEAWCREREAWLATVESLREVMCASLARQCAGPPPPRPRDV
jgi:hypothetical protein